MSWQPATGSPDAFHFSEPNEVGLGQNQTNVESPVEGATGGLTNPASGLGAIGNHLSKTLSQAGQAGLSQVGQTGPSPGFSIGSFSSQSYTVPSSQSYTVPGAAYGGQGLQYPMGGAFIRSIKGGCHQAELGSTAI